MTIREVVESVVLSSFLAFIVISLFKAGVAHSAMKITDEQIEKLNAKSKIIGKIVSFATMTNAQKTLWGEKVAAEGRAINEGETITTIAGQNIEILLNEGSRINVAPSSTIEFTNWNEREDDVHLVRKIHVKRGMAYFKIKKVYSQLEPLIVTTPYSAVSVVGTEFIVDTGTSSSLMKTIDRTKEEFVKSAKEETEVHVFEGTVLVAKTLKRLRRGEDVLSVRAGQYTRIDDSMEKPQGVKLFEVDRYVKYVNLAMPEMKLVVNRETSQSERSMIAMSPTPSTNQISTPDGTVAGQLNRAVASESAATNLTDDEKADLETLKQYKNIKNSARREKFIDEVQ